MRIDGQIGPDLKMAGADAQRAERDGYGGVWSSETSHDPFLPLALAAEHTETLDLGTSIAVAFARSPMTLASVSWDLQELSGGRFILGLGTQIKPHITKRFSMPWSHPAPRAREMIQAIRAIWDCWLNGNPLQFRGEFYTHTLMTPMFTPGREVIEQVGLPRIVLAGVGAVMTEVAGETCDGFLAHGFSTERYLREVSLPALERGRARAGATMDGFDITAPGFVVTGRTDEDMATAVAGTKAQLAFYASTPAYRPVLEVHGWGELQTDLHALSKRGEWERMAHLIDDEMLATFAVVGEPDEIGPGLVQRYGDVATRFNFYAPYPSDRELWLEVMASMT